MKTITQTTDLKNYRPSINWRSITPTLCGIVGAAFLSAYTCHYISNKFIEIPTTKSECIGATLKQDNHIIVLDPVTQLRAVYDNESEKYQSISVEDKTVEQTPEIYSELEKIRICNLK